MENISLNNRMKLGGGALILRPCLTNAYWWQGNNLPALSEITNRIIGEDNAVISNSHCLSFDGASNYVRAGDIADIRVLDKGYIEFIYNSIEDVDTLGQIIYSPSKSSVATDFAYILVGNAIGGATGETLTFFHRRNSITTYAVSVVLGSNYINDGIDHTIKYINDGINNRFIIDGITYDNDGGDLVFTEGDKTNTEFLNNANFNVSLIGARELSNARSLYLNASVANFRICNNNDACVVDLSLSEGDSINVYDRTSGIEYLISGTLVNHWDERQSLHNNNYNNGFDKWIADIGGAVLKVPFDINGDSIKTDGDTITDYTWFARIEQTGSLIIASENTFTINAVDYTFDELEASIDNTLKFANVETGVFIDNSLFLSAEQTEKCYNKTINFYKLEKVYEDDGITIVTEDDGITYAIED